jgi:predicted nucleic acid-binding protein
MDCISVPESASYYYAAVRLKRQKQGLTMEGNDLWIAATVLALGAVLVTADHDFYKIDGLTIEDWTA